MLALILPPVIVIVVLVILVYFFSRRFPQVEREITAQIEEMDAARVRRERIFGSSKRALLYILEHLTQWFKVMTLRAHNASNRLVQNLRAKKAKTTESVDNGPKENFFERTSRQNVSYDDEPSESPSVRPMVSHRVTHPESVQLQHVEEVIEEKVQLEDILVERIASNPRDLEAYERLGEYYMDQGNIQDAKECYRQVLRLSPVHRLAKIKIRRLEKLLEQK